MIETKAAREDDGRYILDGDGNPRAATLDEWEAFRADPATRVIKRTELRAGVYVSTVWVGLDDLLFETMIFGGRYAHEMWRDATRENAMLSHRAAVYMATP